MPEAATGKVKAMPDELAQLQAAIAQLNAASQAALDAGQGGDIAREDIAEVLHVAARLFSAHTDRHGKSGWPVRKDALTATETVVLVTALLEAADINLFDLAIWYRRP